VPADYELKGRRRRWLTSYPGRTLAETIVLAVAIAAALGILAFSVLSVVPLVRRERARRQNAVCRDNTEALAQALRMYLADNDGVIPPPARWCDALTPYVSDTTVLVCPAARNQRCSFALSAALAGTKVSTVPDPGHTVMLFESDAGWNAAGGSELLPDRPRHLGADYYVFADGHVQWMPRKKRALDEHDRPIYAKESDADWVIWEPVPKDEADDR